MTNEGSEIDYVIRVKGRLEPERRAYFGALELTTVDGVTSIAGRAPDQPALHGVLAKVRDLGLPLLSVTCGEAGEGGLGDER
jgi:hypothetical protein